MQKKAAQLLQEVFAFSMDWQPKVHWRLALSHYITYDEKFGQFYFALDPVNQENRDALIDSLNAMFQRGFSDYENLYVTRITDLASQKSYAVVSENHLQRLRQDPEELNLRLNWRIIEGYINDILEAELISIAHQTFNIDVVGDEDRKKKRGEARMIFNDVIYEDDDGNQIPDYALFFCMNDLDWQIDNYELLARDIEDSISKALEFLDGSQFINAEQQKMLTDLLAEDRQPLFLRLPTNQTASRPEQYFPALHIGRAKTMADAGISINLEKIVERHMVPWWNNIVDFRDQEEAVLKAFRRQFNLEGFAKDFTDRRLVYWDSSVAAIDGGPLNSRERRTGRILTRDHVPADLTQIVFTVAASLACLTRKEAMNLKDRLNKVLRADARIPKSHSVFTESKSLNEPGIKISYDLIDFLLRSNIKVDLLPVFAEYYALQEQRSELAKNIIQRLGEASGYKGWSTDSFPRHFFFDKPRESAISLRLERDFTTSENDSPKPTSIFVEQAKRIKSIFTENGLADRVKVATYAGRMAGGLTSHSLTIDMSFNSLEDAAELVAKFEGCKSDLAPAMEAAIAQSALSSCFDTHLFGYPDSDNATYQLMQSISRGYLVAEIEAINQGVLQKDIDWSSASQALKNVGNYIDYLVSAKSAPNAEIKKLASDYLSVLGSLSPAIKSLIEKAETQPTFPVFVKGVLPAGQGLIGGPGK